MDVSRYLGLFVSDARDHLAGLEAESVRVESADPVESRAAIDAVFRHLHSIKGSAATMGFEPIAQLAHHAESFIGTARDGGRALGGDDVDLVLRAVDELRSLVAAVAEGRPLVAKPSLADELARASGERPVAEAPRTVLPADAAVYRLRLSPRSAAPAARAFLALRKLEGLGTIVGTDPPKESLKERGLPGGALFVAFESPPDEVAASAALARVPDVEGFERVAASELPAAAPVPGPVAAAVPGGGDATIRVRVELLDQLLELAGELVLGSGRLREQVRLLPDNVRAPLEHESDRLRALVKDLNNRVLAARQTPLQSLTDRLPRVVRDLSRRLAKPLELAVEGADVTLDRGLLEALAEPLTHALRNAADHGIEDAATRARLGKPPAGRLALRARRERERVVVELHDDGRGFDLEKLRAKAVTNGLLTTAQAAFLDENGAHRLALLPGLSTRESANEVSGRGVGMDAVLRAVEQLGGSLQLASKPGEGSRVRIELPATVSVVNLLLLGVGAEIYGVPMGRVLSATEADLASRGGEGLPAKSIVADGSLVPAYALGRLLGVPELAARGPRPFVVVDAEGVRTAVGVDRVLGQEEVVLRPLQAPLDRIRGLAGTAILGSGRPVFVLDVPRLLD